jgi:transposase InsO family protein
MPWDESKAVEERTRLVVLVEKSRVPVAEAARLFGVSRKTAFKWLALFREGGAAGLVDRSRAPHVSPGAHKEALRTLLIEGRLAHRHWGPRKLLAFLAARRPNLLLPAASTVGLWLHAEGLVPPRRKVVRGESIGGQPFPEVVEANDVWCTDYKGEFRVGNGELCFPFTLTDAHSRFLIRCTAMRQISTVQAQREMESAFKEHGLPGAMRSDNGSPFAAKGVGGLTRLAVWLLRLGVQLQRTTRGRPQENGAHERMHRTLKQETVLEPKSSMARQQRAFDEFRHEYNFERPHEGIANATPSTLFKPSPRRMPRTIPELHYPTDHAVRIIDSNGYLTWRGRRTFLSEALRGERVGIAESDIDGWWRIYFINHELGLLHASGRFVERIHRQPSQHRNPKD